jgi:hypothetical protein
MEPKKETSLRMMAAFLGQHFSSDCQKMMIGKLRRNRTVAVQKVVASGCLSDRQYNAKMIFHSPMGLSLHETSH